MCGRTIITTQSRTGASRRAGRLPMPHRIGLVAIAIAAMVVSGAVYAAERYDFGRPATPAEIAGWDIDASPSGAGLPAGHGGGRQGERTSLANSRSCTE